MVVSKILRLVRKSFLQKHATLLARMRPKVRRSGRLSRASLQRMFVSSRFYEIDHLQPIKEENSTERGGGVDFLKFKAYGAPIVDQAYHARRQLTNNSRPRARVDYFREEREASPLARVPHTESWNHKFG